MQLAMTFGITGDQKPSSEQLGPRLRSNCTDGCLGPRLRAAIRD